MNFSQKLSNLKQSHLYRSRKISKNTQNTQMTINGKPLINFCSNDYLSLASHPQVKEAFKQGVDKFGVGSGSSHLISGHTPAHHALEEALADYTGQKKALLFSTGYMANIGIFSALKDELDWVLQDKLNHASLIDANHLIGLPLQRYLHNNVESLKKKIGKQTELAPHSITFGGQGLVVTDNIFSMDGDQANIKSIEKIVKKYNALLIQDDAHGFGIFEPIIPKNSIYMATLGKAAGTMGAFVAGDEDLIDFLIQKSRPYIYTTAIAPALCVATLKSLELIKHGDQNTKLLANIRYFKSFSKTLNLPITNSNSAIQPFIMGSSKKAIHISKKLINVGFYVSAIRPPTVPKNTARLRITLSARHTQSQIKQLLTQLKYAIQ
ncbi:8-amino-7-oxononanoate synthase [Candidatus Ruthia magnifica str. Cm (Calyptogena magnifica)]|uniref:8-amino-7-oxononanoate synthase n=1 Tax=Ruthia magnifica subsp. Calyptogena magnifica TaxID=413404 RepID=A1AX95_RUTMC|nr:8-amino-7-oxononanoate synthase [Candidatus Ruthturnera calyptogenae]ABL02552.1 8-amino-7-oxononanoate synthase [Candidatus Ruthia magnifica str. Cm (Calyptogena magnifica)]